MLKHLSPQNDNFLTDLFNESFKRGLLPIKWKHAQIIPILKPGKRPNKPDSYRSVALTSTLCKLIEKILVKRLNWYFEKHNILIQAQDGFRTKRGTMDSLTKLDYFVKNKKTCIGIFLDISKAFDTIDPMAVTQILKKLESQDLSGTGFMIFSPIELILFT